MNSKMVAIAGVAALSMLMAPVADGSSSESMRIAFCSRFKISSDAVQVHFLSRFRTDSQSGKLNFFSSCQPGFMLFIR